MKHAYFDSSAIVKLSHAEPHSTALVEYLDSGEVEASTSVIAEVEVMRALRRAGAAADQAVMGFYLLALDAEVREEAARLGSPQVRALDAIHSPPRWRSAMRISSSSPTTIASPRRAR